MKPFGVFTFKHRDTGPILSVTLRDPDGTVTDLTGATSVTLRVRICTGEMLNPALWPDEVLSRFTTELGPGVTLLRTMDIVDPATSGTVEYAWTDADWDVITVGSHRMEYYVVGAVKVSYPNGAYDILKVGEGID